MLYQKRILGILCILLVPLSVGFGFLGRETNLPGWYLSISATYYANSKIFMIGLLSAISVFLFSYQCYDWKDRLVTVIEAIASLGIIVFPCLTPGIPERVGLFSLSNSVSNVFHCLFACILFYAFATQVTFLFTKSGPNPSAKKLVRNKIYRICGIIIYVFITWQIAMSAFSLVPASFPMTLINEFIMLVAYGFCYLVKSESVAKFNDIKIN